MIRNILFKSILIKEFFCCDNCWYGEFGITDFISHSSYWLAHIKFLIDDFALILHCFFETSDFQKWSIILLGTLVRSWAKKMTSSGSRYEGAHTVWEALDQENYIRAPNASV